MVLGGGSCGLFLWGGTMREVRTTRRTPNSPFHVLLLPAVPCFAFQLVLLMKCTMTRHRPTCLLLLSLIVVRIGIANGILVMHGPPAFARGMPVHLKRQTGQ